MMEGWKICGVYFVVLKADFVKPLICQDSKTVRMKGPRQSCASQAAQYRNTRLEVLPLDPVFLWGWPAAGAGRFLALSTRALCRAEWIQITNSPHSQ
jgi:hypothetical protein